MVSRSQLLDLLARVDVVVGDDLGDDLRADLDAVLIPLLRRRARTLAAAIEVWRARGQAARLSEAQGNLDYLRRRLDAMLDRCPAGAAAVAGESIDELEG